MNQKSDSHPNNSQYVFARRALALPDEAIPCYQETASARPKTPRSDMLNKKKALKVSETFRAFIFNLLSSISQKGRDIQIVCIDTGL